MKHLDLHISLIAFLNVRFIWPELNASFIPSPKAKFNSVLLKKSEVGVCVWNLTQFQSEQISGFQ